MKRYVVDTFELRNGVPYFADRQDASSTLDAIATARFWLLCGPEGSRSAKIQDNATAQTYTVDGDALVPIADAVEVQLALF